MMKRIWKSQHLLEKKWDYKKYTLAGVFFFGICYTVYINTTEYALSGLRIKRNKGDRFSSHNGGVVCKASKRVCRV